MFNNIRAKRKGFLIATVVAGLLTALVGYLLMHRLQTESVLSIQQSIDSWRITLTVCRWTVIALVAFGWKVGIEHFAKTGKISFNQVEQLHQYRWRAVTCAIFLVELMGKLVDHQVVSIGEISRTAFDAVPRQHHRPSVP